VSFLPMKSSLTFQRLQECSSLCINVLSGDQEGISQIIARRRENKLNGIDWYPSPSGDPILQESVAWVDVRLDATLAAGDHWIAMCRVVDLAVTNPVAPLIYFQGGYGTFIIPSLTARLDREIIGIAQQATVVRDELEELTRRIPCESSLLVALNRDELVAVASAVSTGVNQAAGLGERMPMVPPIGDTCVYDASPADQEYWLSKARKASEDFLAICRDRLTFCRENGYLLSFLPDDNEHAYESMSEAAHLFAEGPVTPAQQRDICARITGTSVNYDTRYIDDDHLYNIGSIVVPIRESGGCRKFTLRLAQLPRQATGTKVKQWINDSQAMGRRIEERMS
jgi:hypothetical protein